MGIVNVTPDSFSDGSEHADPDAAIAYAKLLIDQGADILDIGGESTRPGADPVTADAELQRILPVIEALRGTGVALSVDTFKPEVMRRVLDAGVDIINDINAFRKEGAVEAVAASRCGLCVMHMQGEPKTMQLAPSYVDVVQEVRAFLMERAQVLQRHGVDPRRIIADPGLGFGKTVEQNYLLLRQLRDVSPQDYPCLLGVSRKSMLGVVVGRPAPERVAASVAAALAGIARGANIVRVHDVAATVDAVKIWHAVEHGVS
jgi:dihydropteroate synthase